MKKFLMILIVLALVASAAFAEGGSPFIAALEETARSFSLEDAGLRAELSAGGQSYAADIQYDSAAGAAEVDLGGYGRLRIDGERAVFLNSGIPFVLNYSAWPGLKEAFTDPGSLGRRAEAALLGLAAKAKEYLADPFFTWEYRDDIFSLRVDISTWELREQLSLFLADLLQDQAVRSVYPYAARALRSAGVWIPESIDDLPGYIASAIPDDAIRRGRLTGDLLVANPGSRYPEIVFSGNYHYTYASYRGTYPLYFSLSFPDGKLSLAAEADTPSGGGSLLLEGSRFYFETRGEKGGAPYFSVDGALDPATGDVSAVIRDSSGSVSGDVSGFLRQDGLDLTVRYYRDVIRVSAKIGGRFLHGKVSVSSREWGSGRSWDLWIGEEADRTFRFRLSGFNPVSWSDDACELLVGLNRLALQYFRGGAPMLDASARYDPASGEINVSGLLNRWNGAYRFSLSGAGGDYEAAFGYPYYDWSVEGSGRILFDPGWLLKSAVFDVTSAGEYSGYTDTAQYALERTEDTAERLAYRLRMNEEALLQAEAELKDEGFGKGIALRVLRGGEPVFSAALIPAPKKLIIPIDISNGVFLTPELVSTMLAAFLR